VGPLVTLAGYGFVEDHPWSSAFTEYDPIARLGGDGMMDLLFTGSYPATTWLAFVLAGMALGRLDLRATTVRARLIAVGAWLVTAGYGGSWLLLHTFPTVTAAIDPVRHPTTIEDFAWWFGPEFGDDRTYSWQWLLVASPHSGTTFEIAGNIGVAVIAIAGCVAATQLVPRFRAAVRPVIAVGTMSLTAYVGHIIGIGLFGIEDLPGQPLPVLLGFAAAAMAFAVLWLRRFRRGPLEYLLHALTRHP
ncbi:MAG: DUF418 domain-containing protein, partial [Pseudonocardiaceae bacterium]